MAGAFILRAVIDLTTNYLDRHDASQLILTALPTGIWSGCRLKADICGIPKLQEAGSC